ncbi:hypothetical protein MANES_09G106400v8 [Manihot esculenta]|uniref:Uncharacterized protein n=1 Tax=Manihot esculenta TaxID=3983 RepID=A0A2C9V9N5_MANES|nr:hypothetical protein MANES_09G106400v8 [Manihot esculenta]
MIVLLLRLEYSGLFSKRCDDGAEETQHQCSLVLSPSVWQISFPFGG